MVHLDDLSKQTIQASPKEKRQMTMPQCEDLQSKSLFSGDSHSKRIESLLVPRKSATNLVYRSIDEWLCGQGVFIAAPEDSMEDYFQSLKQRVFSVKILAGKNMDCFNSKETTKESLGSPFLVKIGNNKLLQKRELRNLQRL